MTALWRLNSEQYIILNTKLPIYKSQWIRSKYNSLHHLLLQEDFILHINLDNLRRDHAFNLDTCDISISSNLHNNIPCTVREEIKG